MSRSNLISIAAVLALCGCASSAKRGAAPPEGPKRRIAVVEFENKTAYSKGRVGDAAAEVLATELARTGKFILVERRHIEKVIEEQKLSASGLVNPETAVRLGNLLGAHAVVLGAVTNFGASTTGSDYLFAQKKKLSVTAVVDVRAVDSETGRVLFVDTGRGEAQNTTSEVMGIGGKQDYNEALEGDALRAAIKQLAERIASQVSTGDWYGRVAEVKDSQIYLDVGKESGVKPGQKLRVLRPGREIRSGESVVGRVEQPVGELQVSDNFGADGSVAMVVKGSEPQAGDIVRLP